MSNLTVSVAFKLLSEQFEAQARASGKAAADAMAQIGASAKTSEPNVKALFDQFGQSRIGQLNGEIKNVQAAFAALATSGKASGADLSNAFDAARAKVQQLEAQAGGLGGTLGGFPGKLTPIAAALGAAFSVTAVVAFTKSVIDAGIAAEQLRNKLNFGAGGEVNGAKALQFIREEANRLGLDLKTSANAFASLTIATQGTSLAGQATRDIFRGVAQAATVAGLSAQQADGAFLALTQIVSKGTVSAEELRGQLGERLPGAFAIAARSMNLTTAELGKLLETGGLASEDFLPKFAAELQRSFGPSSVQAAQSLSAQINRLGNAFETLLQTLSSSGASGIATTVIRTLADALSSVQRVIDALDPNKLQVAIVLVEGIGGAVKDSLVETFKLAETIINQVTERINDVVASFTAFGGAADSARQPLGALQTVILGVGVTAASIADAIRDVNTLLNISLDLSLRAVSSLLDLAAGAVGFFSAKIKAELSALSAEITKRADEARVKALEGAAQQGASLKKVFDSVAEAQEKAIAAPSLAKKLAADFEALRSDITSNNLSLAAQQQAVADVTIRWTELGKTAPGVLKLLQKELLTIPEIIVSTKTPLAKMIEDFAKFGVDAQRAVTGTDKTIVTLIEKLKELAKASDPANPVAASALLREGFEKAFKDAKTSNEVQRITNAVVELGKTGKLTGEDLQTAMSGANRRMGELLTTTLDAAKALTEAGKRGLDVFKADNEVKRASLNLSSEQRKLSDAELVAGRSRSLEALALVKAQRESVQLAQVSLQLAKLQAEEAKALAKYEQAVADAKKAKTEADANPQNSDQQNAAARAKDLADAAGVELEARKQSTLEVQKLVEAQKLSVEAAQEAVSAEKARTEQINAQQAALKAEAEAQQKLQEAAAAKDKDRAANSAELASNMADVSFALQDQLKAMGGDGLVQRYKDMVDQTYLLNGSISDAFKIMQDTFAILALESATAKKRIQDIAAATAGIAAQTQGLSNAWSNVENSVQDALLGINKMATGTKGVTAANKELEAALNAQEQAMLAHLRIQQQIRREALNAAAAFGNSASSIRQELLRLQGKEEEAAAIRFNARKRELDLEFLLAATRLKFAIAQTQNASEKSILTDALSGLNDAYGQAKSDLNEIQKIEIDAIRANAAEKQKQADEAKAAAQKAIQDQQEAQRKALVDAAQQEQAANEKTQADKLAALAEYTKKSNEAIQAEQKEKVRSLLEYAATRSAIDAAAKTRNLSQDIASRADELAQNGVGAIAAAAAVGGTNIVNFTPNITVNAAQDVDVKRLVRDMIPELGDALRRSGINLAGNR